MDDARLGERSLAAFVGRSFRRGPHSHRRGEVREFVLGAQAQEHGGERGALLGCALVARNGERCFRRRRQCERGAGGGAGRGKTQPPDEMRAGLKLLEHHDELRARLEREFGREFKDGVMRLADFRMNGPRRFQIAVERLGHVVAGLIEVRRRAPDFHPLRQRHAGAEDLRLEFGDVQIPVVRTARPFHRQRVVGEQVEAQRGDFAQLGRERERHRVRVLARAAGEDGAVGLAREGRAVCGEKRLRIERLPRGQAAARGLPFGDERFVFRREQRLAIRREQRLPARTLPRDSGIFVEGDIAFPDARKDGLQRVVILLRDRVELVRVAAGAVRGGADEGGHRLRHEVVAVEVLEGLRRGARGA